MLSFFTPPLLPSRPLPLFLLYIIFTFLFQCLLFHNCISSLSLSLLCSFSLKKDRGGEGREREGALYTLFPPLHLLTQFLKGVSEFLGIPYAQPPIGPLRWKPPQPAASFSGNYCNFVSLGLLFPPPLPPFLPFLPSQF